MAASGREGASGVSAVTGVGVRVPLHPWVSLEPSGGFTIGGLDVQTAAGDVTLSLRRATLEIVVAPVTHRGLSAGVGAGGGVAWLSAVPRANAGYEGTEQSTQVSLLALRGFGAWQTRHLKGSPVPRAFDDAPGGYRAREAEPSFRAWVNPWLVRRRDSS